MVQLLVLVLPGNSWKRSSALDRFLFFFTIQLFALMDVRRRVKILNFVLH